LDQADKAHTLAKVTQYNIITRIIFKKRKSYKKRKYLCDLENEVKKCC